MKTCLGVLAAGVVYFLSATLANAQGCSDAGFCSINSLKPHASSPGNQTKNQVKIGSFVGSADNNISVVGAYSEFSKQLSKSFAIDAKITSINQSGNGINMSGLGDVFINTRIKTSASVQLIGGLKIPLTSGNAQLNGLSLPMDYQASLGTLDAIVGVSYQLKQWQVMAAIQQPLTQNKNEFLASSHAMTSPLSMFQSTKNFKRAGDILVRVAYPFKAGSKWVFTPSLLPIYHLGADRFLNEVTNKEEKIAGSEGLTLNGNLYADYLLSSHSSLQVNLATPFIVRAARPDGLTRGFIATIEYSYRF